MFLPNLQKNIQELERQISRLETECEHMGRRETDSPVQESTNEPFITGPTISTTTYSKLLDIPDVRPAPKLPGDLHSPHVAESPKPPEKRSKTCCADSRNEHRPNNSPRHPHEKKNAEPAADLKRHKRSTHPPREASESSDENHLSRKIMMRLKNKLKETSKKTSWCDLLGEQFGVKTHHRSRQRDPREVSAGRKEHKVSSDEEDCRSGRAVAGERVCKELEPVEALRSKRRPRSARTQKNHHREIPVEAIPPKSLKEKETQCLLWNGDKCKGEFFFSVNERVKVLQGLIEELKKKPSQEKRNDVLNDMESTLKKISEIKEFSAFNQPPLQSFLKYPEGLENMMNMKHALFAMKKVCEELFNEKSALAEEISVKNVTITNFIAKEKEYLALISGLRYNLDKQKEAAEEGTQAKRDLKILQVKLQEETKVIEALKKSHTKMQELVENYVLENDKLKADVKITKLESQKYNVLLAGKQAEIIKYRKEIEAFQKQITEQLSLLRSKATESEVQQTIEAISNQARILKKDDPSEQQDDDETLESSSTKTLMTCRRRSPPPPSPLNSAKHEREPHPGCAVHKRPADQFGFDVILADTSCLRDSINELLEDIKRESSEAYWVSTANSCITSARSVTTSEDVSDVSQRD